MNESEEEEVLEKKSNPIWQNPVIKSVLIFGAVALVAFLLGFVPMWLKSRENSRNLAETQRQLKISRLQNLLGSAIVDAQRAEYEPARQSASDFFTELQTETGQENNSTLTTAQSESLKSLFAQRDEIITLLARNDPAAVGRLSNLYVSYRKIIEGV